VANTISVPSRRRRVQRFEHRTWASSRPTSFSASVEHRREAASSRPSQRDRRIAARPRDRDLAASGTTWRLTYIVACGVALASAAPAAWHRIRSFTVQPAPRSEHARFRLPFGTIGAANYVPLRPRSLEDVQPTATGRNTTRNNLGPEFRCRPREPGQLERLRFGPWLALRPTSLGGQTDQGRGCGGDRGGTTRATSF
jgi:hypothetical protein